MRVRGETIPEITGATRLMRERMLPVEAPPSAVDIVGTGGDGHNTFNVSTAAAIVLTVLGLTLVGESLNDLADPRLRARRRAADVPPPADVAVTPGGGLAAGTEGALP